MDTGIRHLSAPIVPHPVRHRGRGRRLREALLVCVITLGVSLVLLEMGLRLFLPQNGPGLIDGDPYTGLFVADAATVYRNAPGVSVRHRSPEINTTYTTNSQGLREDREVGSPAPGSARLLCLGDSFTFGWGVDGDQTYPDLLSGSQTADGRLLESLNTGVMGYGTDNEAVWLHTYGWALKPQIVLVGFFVGNDVSDVMAGMNKTHINAQNRLTATNRPGMPAGDADETPAVGPLGTVKQWLAHHSHAYVFLRSLTHNLLQPSPPTTLDDLDREVKFFRRTEPPDIAAGWDKATGLLDAMRADTEAHGARFVVVALPTLDQVQDGAWQALARPFAADALVRDQPQRKLAAWAAHTQTPLIDLLPGFRAAESSKLYFQLDRHWNAAGHALAARLIRAALIQQGLLSR